MNNLTKTLLGGVALTALAAVPANAAKHPAMHVTALHAGKAVNKTKMHVPGRQHLTYTFGVYSYQPASAPPAQHIFGTYYKWNSSGNLCTAPKEKNKVPKKSIYGKLGTATETYSEGCSNGPTVFYGDTWTNKTGVAGNIDQWRGVLTGKFQNGSTKYKGTLNLDVRLTIE
jgi:hypothetical protein